MTQGTLLSVLVVVSCCALAVDQGAPAASQATETASRLKLGTPIDRQISGRQQAGEWANLDGRR